MKHRTEREYLLIFAAHLLILLIAAVMVWRAL